MATWLQRRVGSRRPSPQGHRPHLRWSVRWAYGPTSSKSSIRTWVRSGGTEATRTASRRAIRRITPILGWLLVRLTLCIRFPCLRAFRACIRGNGERHRERDSRATPRDIGAQYARREAAPVHRAVSRSPCPRHGRCGTTRDGCARRLGCRLVVYDGRNPQRPELLDEASSALHAQLSHGGPQ